MNLEFIVFNNPLKRLLTAAIISLTMLLITQGCTPGAGRLSRSTEITESFESYQIFPDYTYYYKGYPTRPYAIVALLPDYEINSRFWNEFAPDSKTLKRLVDAIYRDRDEIYPFGANLLDSVGRRIGIWYSSVRTVGVTVDETQRLVSITTDQPWVRDDRKLHRSLQRKKEIH